MNNLTTCLGPCNPRQIINILIAISDVSILKIYHNCGQYGTDELEYAYSIDNICWSCYMSYSDILANTINIGTDFYLRIKVNGAVKEVTMCDEAFYNYRCSIAEGFNFSYSCSENQNQNLFNPYLNMDCAIALQQQLTETVACMFGVPIYYIKLTGNQGSKDLTFKEYTLMNVEAVKQIKMVIQDNMMPSSKPEFSDWGIDFQSDWEVEISKGMFATAFGTTAQPMEGDLIYVPMMKRMWMVNGAYEEKKEAIMWNATTFKLMLIKYQEKGSVDLGDAQSMVDSLVKNKYEDLFGEDENIESGVYSVEEANHIPDNLYPVYESDSTRKYVSVNTIDFAQGIYYQNGTMIADSQYTFLNSATKNTIIYQHKYCGEDGTLSFIIQPKNSNYNSRLFKIGSICINIEQKEGIIKNGRLIKQSQAILSIEGIDKLSLTLNGENIFFVYIRWNRMMNCISMSYAKYTHKDVPEYMLQNMHYYFDIDNAVTVTDKYDVNFIQETKGDVILNNLVGNITNIKLFDKDNDNISEILQMFPTNQHLIINDTARKLVKADGISLN